MRVCCLSKKQRKANVALVGLDSEGHVTAVNTAQTHWHLFLAKVKGQNSANCPVPVLSECL